LAASGYYSIRKRKENLSLYQSDLDKQNSKG